LPALLVGFLLHGQDENWMLSMVSCRWGITSRSRYRLVMIDIKSSQLQSLGHGSMMYQPIPNFSQMKQGRSHWLFNKFYWPIFRVSVKCLECVDQWREVYQIWGGHRTIVSSQVCFRFHVCRCSYRRGRLKGDCGQKSKPNFAVFDPL